MFETEVIDYELALNMRVHGGRNVVTFFTECCYLLNNFLFSVGKPVPPIRRSGLRMNTRRMSRHV